MNFPVESPSPFIYGDRDELRLLWTVRTAGRGSPREGFPGAPSHPAPARNSKAIP